MDLDLPLEFRYDEKWPQCFTTSAEIAFHDRRCIHDYQLYPDSYADLRDELWDP